MSSRLWKWFMCASLGLAAAATVEAQQVSATSADVDEIVVTAQRRAQSLSEVPLAITALDGDSLSKQGITNSAELASAVPNLQISSPYGNTQPNFSLRGVSVANEYNSNQASPIGVYIDDVYIAARTSQGMGLFDLDRVEVLRGPQGTLFGRNTTGGAINFITRSPTLTGENGYVEAGYGNFNTYTAQGAFEETLIDGQLGFRIAANYVKGNGQIENVFPGGSDPNSQDSRQVRVSLRFKAWRWAVGHQDSCLRWARQPDPSGGAGFAAQSGRSGFFPSR